MAAISYAVWASDTNKKVVKFEQTFDKIAQIAEKLEDPNNWLRQYLLVKGVDSTTAKVWSTYPRGCVKDLKDNCLSDILFLDPSKTPELGIQMVIKDDGTLKVLDTLWNFLPKDSL